MRPTRVSAGLHMMQASLGAIRAMVAQAVARHAAWSVAAQLAQKRYSSPPEPAAAPTAQPVVEAKALCTTPTVDAPTVQLDTKATFAPMHILETLPERRDVVYDVETELRELTEYVRSPLSSGEEKLDYKRVFNKYSSALRPLYAVRGVDEHAAEVVFSAALRFWSSEPLRDEIVNRLMMKRGRVSGVGEVAITVDFLTRLGRPDLALQMVREYQTLCPSLIRPLLFPAREPHDNGVTAAEHNERLNSLPSLGTNDWGTVWPAVGMRHAVGMACAALGSVEAVRCGPANDLMDCGGEYVSRRLHMEHHVETWRQCSVLLPTLFGRGELTKAKEMFYEQKRRSNLHHKKPFIDTVSYVMDLLQTGRSLDARPDPAKVPLLLACVRPILTEPDASVALPAITHVLNFLRGPALYDHAFADHMAYGLWSPLLKHVMTGSRHLKIASENHAALALPDHQTLLALVLRYIRLSCERGPETTRSWPHLEGAMASLFDTYPWVGMAPPPAATPLVEWLRQREKVSVICASALLSTPDLQTLAGGAVVARTDVLRLEEITTGPSRCMQDYAGAGLRLLDQSDKQRVLSGVEEARLVHSAASAGHHVSENIVQLAMGMRELSGIDVEIVSSRVAVHLAATQAGVLASYPVDADDPSYADQSFDDVVPVLVDYTDADDVFPHPSDVAAQAQGQVLDRVEALPESLRNAFLVSHDAKGPIDNRHTLKIRAESAGPIANVKPLFHLPFYEGGVERP
eukprot:TRINITY_DN22352_c0_g1_i1.p1 TRINITY_DN22352_c0_g1~~TRINITY_DN22352_c0_g1_i1.p1  ORF type:complete len:744 (+),score=151.66 TRINITY_DN22352_c0_g1_i1:87-2318(+)